MAISELRFDFAPRCVHAYCRVEKKVHEIGPFARTADLTFLSFRKKFGEFIDFIAAHDGFEFVEDAYTLADTHRRYQV
jgi:hypothetical protein